MGILMMLKRHHERASQRRKKTFYYIISKLPIINRPAPIIGLFKPNSTMSPEDFEELMDKYGIKKGQGNNKGDDKIIIDKDKLRSMFAEYIKGLKEGYEHADFKTEVGPFIKECLRSNGIPMFRTKGMAMNTALGICWGGNPDIKSRLFVNIPPEDYIRMMMSTGDWKWINKKYGDGKDEGEEGTSSTEVLGSSSGKSLGELFEETPESIIEDDEGSIEDESLETEKDTGSNEMIVPKGVSPMLDNWVKHTAEMLDVTEDEVRKSVPAINYAHKLGVL